LLDLARGSQFLDSPGTGKYLTYLCDEIVPFVDERYRTIADARTEASRASPAAATAPWCCRCSGPTSGAASATHAGDALFETCYQPEFRESARILRDQYDGSFENFWKDFRSRPAMSKDSDGVLLNDWCMAACYSTDPDGTVRLPFDTVTGELIPEVWERWLALDPVRMVPGHADALRSLRAIYIDAGDKDQFYLDLGAEAFRRALEQIGVTDIAFELFDGTHMGIEYRYPLSLKYLAERLSA
jgi:hypothetical protein